MQNLKPFIKRFFISCLFALLTATAFAQTPEEIISRMTAIWEEHQNEGVIMTVDTKMPILGTITMREYVLGNKSRTEGKTLGIFATVWDDGVTLYSYTDKTNTVTIKNSSSKSSSDGGDEKLFYKVSEGYDLSIKKETADSWLILCKKSKDNPEENLPDKVEVTVAKGTFFPISLKAKVVGIGITMRDISFGVKEDYVTFRMEDYPDADVEDKRGKEK
jgi:hypothetical protein